MGARPTHPELLDYLAATFVDNGWSIKKMHRLILLSNTYQQSSEFQAEAAAVDPDNKLLWRYGRAIAWKPKPSAIPCWPSAAC